jgi:bifunctional non-homologous end joining protein LigD
MAPPRSFVRFKARVLEGAKPAPFPGFVAPCRPTPGRKAPRGDEWVHELALAGIRVQAHLAQARATLWEADGLDCTRRFGPIADALAKLPANHAVVDGIVVAQVKGRASLRALRADLARNRAERMAYYAFDLLHIDGFDLRGAALVDRKRVLAEFIAEASLARVVICDHLEGDGAAMLRQACARGHPGIVCKRRGAPYRSGLSADWILVACGARLPARSAKPSR